LARRPSSSDESAIETASENKTEAPRQTCPGPEIGRKFKNVKPDLQGLWLTELTAKGSDINKDGNWGQMASAIKSESGYQLATDAAKAAVDTLKKLPGVGKVFDLVDEAWEAHDEIKKMLQDPHTQLYDHKGLGFTAVNVERGTICSVLRSGNTLVRCSGSLTGNPSQNDKIGFGNVKNIKVEILVNGKWETI
jgi:hypothetical protein